MKKNKRNELIFKCREKGFNSDISETYNAEDVFNRLFNKNYEGRTPANYIKVKCEILLSLDNKTIKNKLLEVYNRIKNDVKQRLKNAEIISKNIPLDININFLKTSIFDKIDLVIKDVVDKNIVHILPFIRTMIIRFNNVALFDVQLIAGVKLYHESVLEVKTGEGKTYIIPIAAILFGIRTSLLNQYYKTLCFNDNIPPEDRFQVHIVTANEYLARRDYTLLQELYDFFQLSSYYIQDEEKYKRIPYYSYDLVYCTCRHLCHLGLYDMRKDERQLSFLPNFRYVAIIDEIDQILMDEALTPHILSGSKHYKNFEIDIIYQATHLAKKIANTNTLFKYNESNHFIEFTEIGELFFSKVFIDVYAEIMEDSSILTSLRDLLTLRLNLINSTQNELYQEVINDSAIDRILLYTYSKLEKLFRIYFHFVWTIIESVDSKVYLRNEEILLHITEIKNKFKNFQFDDFKSFFISMVLKFDIEIFNQLFSIIEHPKPNVLIQNHKKILGVNKACLQAINECFKSYKIKNTSIIKVLYLLNINDLPLLIKNGRIALGIIDITLEDIYPLLDIKSDVLCLNEPIEDILKEYDKFISYMKLKTDTIEDIFKINIFETFDFLMRIASLPETYGIEFIINLYINKNRSSNFSDKTTVEKFLSEKLRFVREKLLSDTNTLAINKDVLNWEVEASEFFNGKIPITIHEFLLDMENFFNTLDSVENEFFVLLKGVAQKKMSHFISEQAKKFRLVKSKKEYTEFLSELLGTIIHWIYKLYLAFTNKSKSLSPFRNIFVICLGTLILFVKHKFSRALFEEFYNNMTVDIHNYLKHSDKSYITVFFEDHIVHNLILGFGLKNSDQKGFLYIKDQVLYDVVRLINNMEKKKSVFSFIDNNSWLFGNTFYDISPSSYHSKEIELKYNNSRVISDHYYDLLSYYNLIKDHDSDYFFSMVQRSFNSVFFYKSKIDYIINSIDLDSKSELQKDPYTNKYEDKEIVIIDKITGRPLLNQQWSDNIHSCVEANENILVRGDWQSSAQITPQTLFGLYEYLVGLSGTTFVGKKEFNKKYQLPVELIPTNQPINRQQLPDKFNYTRNGTLNEIIFDTLEINYTINAPVLIVLENIKDCDELHDRILKLHNIIVSIKKDITDFCHHNKISLLSNKEETIEDTIEKIKEIWNRVFKTTYTLKIFLGWKGIKDSADSLNDYYKFFYDTKKKVENIPIENYSASTFDPGFIYLCSQYILNNISVSDPKVEVLDGRPKIMKKESEIIKIAGHLNSVLISTRVTGRGTDIVLKKDDNNKHPGLYIHILNHQKSKRHDLQIIGRCGRQGDKGYYRFYNCFESDWFKEKMASFISDKYENIALYQAELSLSLKQASDEFNLSEFFSSFIDLYQAENEERNLRYRLYEKKIGDMIIKYQSILSFNHDFSDRSYINEHIDLKQFSSNIPNKLKAIIAHGCIKANELKTKLHHKNYTWFIDVAIFLINLGYPKTYTVKFLEGLIFPLTKNENNDVLLFQLKSTISLVIDTIWDYKISSGHKNNNQWMLINEAKLEIIDICYENVFSKLSFDKESIEIQNNNLKRLFDYCNHNSKLESLTISILNIIFHKFKRNSLETYNKYISLFQSKFAHRYDDPSTINKFWEESDFFVQNLSTETSMGLFIAFKIFVPFLIAINKEQKKCEEYYEFLLALPFIGVKIEGINFQSETKQLLKKLVEYFHLPINWNELFRVNDCDI